MWLDWFRVLVAKEKDDGRSLDDGDGLFTWILFQRIYVIVESCFWEEKTHARKVLQGMRSILRGRSVR